MIRRFQLGGESGESGEVLALDVQVANHVAEIVFDTLPPDAALTFDLADATGSCVFSNLVREGSWQPV